MKITKPQPIEGAGTARGFWATWCSLASTRMISLVCAVLIASTAFPDERDQIIAQLPEPAQPWAPIILSVLGTLLMGGGRMYQFKKSNSQPTEPKGQSNGPV